MKILKKLGIAKISKAVALAIWCVIVLLTCIAARSFLSTVILLATLVLLLFCTVSVKKSSHTMQVQLTMPEQILQGKKKSGKLVIKNTGGYPLFCVKGTICCKCTDAEEPLTQQFTCAVKPYMQETVVVKINSAQEGTVHVWLSELTVYDMLGLFCHDADTETLTACVTVTAAQTGEAEATSDAEKV